MARSSRFLNDDNWIETTSGTGTVVFTDNGKTANFDAPTGSAAFIINSVVGWPGDSFEFSILARNIETGKDLFSELIIDSPAGTRQNEVRIEAETMELYTIRYDIPLGAAEPRVVNFAMGSDTPTSGSGEFTLPRIEKTKGDDSFLYATYRIASGGGCTVHPTIKSFNTDDANIVWDAGNIWFLVTPTETTSTLFTDGVNDFKPILQAIATSGNSTTKPITWNIEGLNDNGAFHIQALDELGQRIDLSAGVGLDLFVTVTLEIK